MRFQVLGPLAIVDPERSADNVPPRQRIVLAMLLLQANKVVPVEQLVDAVWNGRPPRTARSQIHICVSRLRQGFSAIGLPDVIVTRAPGYAFRVVADQVDLHLFRSRVAEGRAAVQAGELAGGARLLRRALALWRGQAFANVKSEKVQSAAVSLTEERLAVVEECIDLEIRLGRHRELIGELTEFTAEHPFRERLRAQLMLCLYRAGGQVAALAAFQDARRLLSDELGLEPGRELRELEAAILVADPALESVTSPAPYGRGGPTGTRPLVAGSPSAVPRLLPADIGDFTGRTAITARLRGRLAGERDGRTGPGHLAPPLEIITGKGGIGKTTLAVHLAHQLADEYPDGQLYVSLRDGSARAVDPGQVLEALLRALGVTDQELPVSREARAARYRDMLAGRRVLILLDDAVSEDQVLPLLPGTPSCAVLITCRARLAGLAGARRTVLGEFTTEESEELVGRMLGQDVRACDTGDLRLLAGLCGGLPLALRIAGSRLVARPHWIPAQLTARLADRTRTLDELTYGSRGVRENIALSYRELPEAARRLLRLLTVVDAPDFGGWVASALLGVGLEQATDVLDALTDVHLVEAEFRESGPPRYRVHDLIRLYAREQLDSVESQGERRAAWHRMVGAWLFLAEQALALGCGGPGTVTDSHVGRWVFSPSEVEAIVGDQLDWLGGEQYALGARVLCTAQCGDHAGNWSPAEDPVTARAGLRPPGPPRGHTSTTSWLRSPSSAAVSSMSRASLGLDAIHSGPPTTRSA